ncbi:hypothetical protein B566_EDAN011448 [Ephemera danica]|nr:hypothetical protein B566_EDAN011448 [Ephemera danica]
MVCGSCIGVMALGAIFGLILLAIKLRQKKSASLKNKHVLVTGGSLGIGKCVALEAARRGAHVTIIARNVENLERAVSEIKSAMDLSSKFETLDQAVEKLEESVAPVFMLVNCAGTAVCGKLEDMSDNDIKYLLNLNVLGTMFPCKALVPRMKARKEGHIVITASQAALLGIFGYSVYSATNLPPDTDTPGFAEEEKSKPQETRLISESAGLVSPERVANQMLDDALNYNFFSTVGFESAMLTTACAGMAPFSSFRELAIQVCSAGVLRIVSVLVLHQFNRIVSKCQRDRDTNKKAE